MKIVDIIYYRYLDPLGQNMTIGGIQTYITHLADLAVRLGCCVRIFQFADINFQKEIAPSISVHGIKIFGKLKKDRLIASVLRSRDETNQYVTIFANADYLLPRFKVAHSIGIQHGVAWDKLDSGKRPLWLRLFKHMLFAHRLISQMKNVEEIVCVDNNFINWYRALDNYRHVLLTSILNFTEIQPLQDKKKSDEVSIVFARRFFDYRGTRIFAPVVKRLLQDFPKIQVTFAGEGPDEKYLRDMFKNVANVHFTQYDSRDSITFHHQFDIAVVPTTGSEGTSLSLLEAMAAGCAVVCTNVGGMTNIIIDGYNGLMVNPNIDEFYFAMHKLVGNKALMQQIATNGYQTVKTTFTLEIWEQKWSNVLKKHINK